MKKIVVLAASSSSTSVNRKLANHAGSQVSDVEVQQIDINDYEAPLYSFQREENDGIPDIIKKFTELVKGADGVVISFAEHNGSYTAAFKNLLDWASRADQKTWSEKTLLLLSTSPGPRGAMSVLDTAVNSFPHFGAKVAASFSLPSFFNNFSEESGIADEQLSKSFEAAVQGFSKALHEA